MEMMNKIDDFKAELHELLKKYNASISCNVSGDTHGLIYEMVVDFGSDDKWKEYKLSDSSGVDWNDI